MKGDWEQQDSQRQNRRKYVTTADGMVRIPGGALDFVSVYASMALIGAFMEEKDVGSPLLCEPCNEWCVCVCFHCVLLAE
jgi:hypothetical protein